jgi:hypothetical protein
LFGAGTKNEQEIEQPFRLVELHPRKPRRFFAFKKKGAMKRVCNLCHNPKDISELVSEDAYRCKECQMKVDLDKRDPSEYVKNRRKVDPIFKLKMNILGRSNSALKASYWLKGSNNEKLFGADRDTVMNHIESLFKPGMNWQNKAFWQIDHVVPLSSAKTESQLYNLAHYKNLSPEWKEVNLKKSGKIPDEVLRIGNEVEKASELVSWYYFKVDCSLEIAKECAIHLIEFMLVNTLADIGYWELVKDVIKNDKFYLKNDREIDYFN